MGKTHKDLRKTIRFWVILSVIFLIPLLIAEGYKTSPDYLAFFQNISLSVFCSIIASGIYALVQDSSEDEVRKEEMAELKRIDEELQIVNRKLTIQSDLYDNGIISIRKKSYYEDEGKFWRDIINNTSDRLDLIGHTISNWFKPEYRDVFIKKVTEMLVAGKEVHIVLSGQTPNMEQIHMVENNGKESRNCRFSNNMDRTCWELRQIYKSVSKPAGENLHVYIADPQQVTYMYIRTDKQCFMSPYISSKNADSNTFLLELKTKTEYSRCFDDDFDELVRQIDFQLQMEE